MTKRPHRRPASLAAQYTRLLATMFLLLETLVAAIALYFVFLPMAERSADDLAGLMVLSAQTWAELPPQTRPDFEDELARNHQLALRPDMQTPADTMLLHGFYVGYLERAMASRLGREVYFHKAMGIDGGDWLWTTIPVGGRQIGAGFAAARMQTNPLIAAGAAIAAGSMLALLLAWWMARRIALPIARLETAAAQLAHGTHPTAIPQQGPRELAELAAHFNTMARQVRELMDARTTLFAGISHDLRTPLARIRLALAMLTLRPAPKLIERIESDVEEMNGLIAQLLDLARGLGTEATVALPLAAWLNERADLHRAAAQAAHSTLSVQCDAALCALAAPGMLARIVDNLIDNALRYAPGEIELRAEPHMDVAANGERTARIRLSVVDRGPGIADADRAAVFQPFWRLERSRNPQTGGYGLGLAIVRQLAQAHGWQVGLDARAGAGLIAWIDLPVG